MTTWIKKVLRTAKAFMMIIIMMVFITIICFNAADIKANTPKVGTTYSGFMHTPINNTFGTASLEAAGALDFVEKEICNCILWTTNERNHSYPATYVIIYKFNKNINVRIEKFMNELRYISAGMKYSLTISHSQGSQICYEESASNTMAESAEGSIEMEVNGLDYAKIAASASQTVESQVSSMIGIQYTYTYSQTQTETFEITPTSPSYYSLESRGDFEIYVIQVYKIEYQTTNVQHHGGSGIFGYDTWDYVQTGYKLVEQNVQYRYVRNTTATGLYRYSYQNGIFVYDDVKHNNVIYY